MGIPYSEIESYSRLMDISFSPWETDTIKAMDLAYISFIHNKSKK